MALPTNLSFETPGILPGEASAWTWTTSTSWHWASYPRIGGVASADSFEFQWGADDFSAALDDTNSERNFFSMPTDPLPADGFERHWNNDGFLYMLGATAFCNFVNHPTAVISTDPFDGFESEWDNDDFEFVLGDAEAALYNVALDPVEAFESEWRDNEDFLFAFAPGDLSAALFREHGITDAAETFEAFVEDQAFVVTLPSTFTVPAHGFSNGNIVRLFSSIYVPNSVLPRGLPSNVNFFVKNKTADTFELSFASGGASIVMTDVGGGTNLVRSDPTITWGGINGDTMGEDP